MLKKLFAKIYGAKGERVVPATYLEELEHQNYHLIPLLGPFLLFAWVPYISIDKELFPEIWLFPYLRVGFSVSIAIVLIVFRLNYFKNKGIFLVTIITGYLVIIGSFIPALAHANCSYVGGLCFLIVGLATAPLPIRVHFSLLGLSLLTFLGTCLFLEVKFDNKFWLYSRNDLFTSFVFSGFYGYILNKIRKNTYLKNVKITTQNALILEQNRTIVSQHAEIEKKNTVITDGIEYAKNIQQAILPDDVEIKKQFKNHFIFYKPKDIVSGDFYWLHADEERILFAVADCTGHGVSGAFMSLMGYNLLENITNASPKLVPSEILEELNKLILHVLKQKDKSNSAKFGMDIALISINKKSNQLEFSGAHNSIYIFRNNDCIELKADKRAIGSFIKDEQKGFTNHQFQLMQGDVFYMFTDGYHDQLGGPENKKYFKQNFFDLLKINSGREMYDQKEILDKTISDWKGNEHQTDDMLIIGIKI